MNQERYRSESVIQSDIANYYSYLPAAFYENDLTLSFLNDTANKPAESKYYNPNKTPQGHYVIKMSMGMALSYLPFFGMAHVYAGMINYPTNGFSAPYHLAVQLSSLFYFVIALLFLYRMLRNYFSEFITLLVLCLLSFGTNIYYYLTIGAGMSHIFNFMLVTLFLYCTIRWHKVQSFKQACFIGLLVGMLVLVRPVNILIVLLLFFYEVNSFQDVKQKFQLLVHNRSQVIGMIAVATIVCLPQLVYWHYISGQYFFNSYVGEHFYFNKPHISDGLFSFRKGWLVYTPLMTLSLVGFWFLKDKLKAYTLVIPLFFVLYIYVVFSWWCWWYGGSFGQRALIDVYPLLAISLCAFFNRIVVLSKAKRIIIYSVAWLLVGLNLFQTIQSKYNIIHFDSMTRAAYVDVFFTITKKADREVYLKHPDYEKALKGENE